MGDIDDVQTRVHAVLGQASIGFSVLAVGVRVSSIVRVQSFRWQDWMVDSIRKKTEQKNTTGKTSTIHSFLL